jgi:hypothetical protein
LADQRAEIEPAEEQDVGEREALAAEIVAPVASGTTGMRFSKNFRASPKR